MKLMESMKFFLNLFYVLGFSPYHRRNESSPISIIGLTFISIQAIICELLAIWAFYILTYNGFLVMNSRIDTLIVSMYVLTDMIRSAFILMQNLRYKNDIPEIIRIFLDLELYFEEYFQHRICYQKFKQKYIYKAVLVIGVALSYIASFFVRLCIGDLIGIPGYMIKILQLMTAISYCHILLYIEMLNFHLKQLNLVILRDTLQLSNEIWPSSSVMQAEILGRLKSYKFVHFRLWMVKQKINNYFGYSIMAILMHTFTDSMYSFFWSFEQFYSSKAIAWSMWSMWSMIKSSLQFGYFIDLQFVFVGPGFYLINSVFSFLIFVNSSYSLVEEVSECLIRFAMIMLIKCMLFNFCREMT